MTTLYQYRAVDRFRPLAPAGSSPLHFVLDEAGAMLLAAEDGITTADLGYRRDRAMAIALSPRLAHDYRGERDLHRAGRRRPRQRRPGRPGVLVVRAALRRRLGRPRPPRRVRPLARAAPRPAARRHRLLPRVRHRHRDPAPGSSPSSPGTPPWPPAPASPPPSCSGCPARAARPRCAPGWPARRRTAPATPPRPRRSPASRSPPPPPAPAPTARPGRPGCPPAAPGRGGGSPSSPRPAPPRAGGEPGRRDARCPARRPGLASAVPRPARLARPARRAPPRAARR